MLAGQSAETPQGQRKVAVVTDLYRPTLHQIRAFQWREMGRDAALTCVRDALTHVTAHLEQSDKEALLKDLERHQEVDSPVLTERDLRYPVVQSTTFYPVPASPPIRVAFYAYQHGNALLLHAIWLYDADGTIDTFKQLSRYMWEGHPQAVPGNLGQGLLLTAVVSDYAAHHVRLAKGVLAPFQPLIDTLEQLHQSLWPGPKPSMSGNPGHDSRLIAVSTDPNTDDVGIARQILASFQSPLEQVEIPLTAAYLSCARLYLHGWEPLEPTSWPVVMLFDNRPTEGSVAVGQLVEVEWPQIVLHHLRLERQYLGEYRHVLLSELERQAHVLRSHLKSTLNSRPTGILRRLKPQQLSPEQNKGQRHSTLPQLLSTRDPGPIFHALAGLGGPQYSLLESLGEAEDRVRQAKRELDNLEASVRRVASTPLSGSPPSTDQAQAVVHALTRQERYYLAQMQSDEAAARHLLERTNRAMGVLRAQADSLNARYQRLLAMVIAAVGAGLAIGGLAGGPGAKIIYIFGVGWVWERFGGYPAAQQMGPGALLYVQLVSILLGALLGFLAIRLVMRFARW